MKGETRFCQAQYIESNLNDLFRKLNREPVWETRDQAKKQLAFYKSELNMIHPFRGGTGRVSRLIIREAARNHRYNWDFGRIDSALYTKTMIRSVIDVSSLQSLFHQTLTTCH
ncbi:putative adenosine monophosphate-protein transferase fic [Virgibacillus dokdonensis]|uniref:Putative adenosine monophosphate-protein transferase fic n=2 Tax=Bacillaceae TaxID=186817 RepID=A0A2K9J4X7_9BACI|nr:putative adenosine monophosphate-protein transferase fic [Virgibacillus dokdonensis]